MHSAIHFTAGMAVGTALLLPGVMRAYAGRQKLAVLIRRWLLVSYGLGLYAILPGLLRHAGVPDSFCSGWWMNVFLFHPLLNMPRWEGMPLGVMGIAASFILPYGLILLALLRKRHEGTGPSS